MNVFVLDHDMQKSAQMLDDAHLKAQINEACQILMANWNHEHYPDAKIGHLSHPVTEFYADPYHEIQLLTYLRGLLEEYEYRFNKSHQNSFWCAGYSHAKMFISFPGKFKRCKTYVNGRMTDDIDEIRRYISTKHHAKPLTWTHREKPDWWGGEEH